MSSAMRSITRLVGVAAALAVAALGVACSGGDGTVGTTCGSSSDCADSLQCVAGLCVPRCDRGPDCGDGYACAADGSCVAATGEAGDACAAETACAAGLACVLDDTDRDGDGALAASCSGDRATGPAGAACASDDDCRNRTCALGHCVDLCREDRDCGDGMGCTTIPRIEAPDAPTFLGCLPTTGSLTWRIPVAAPRADLLLPVPATARSATLSMAIDAPGQRVGAAAVTAPDGTRWYTTPLTEADYFANPIRHKAAEERAVLALPGSPDLDLVAGAYPITVSSFRFLDQTGTVAPEVWATIKLDDGDRLDLHYVFLDLAEQPCAAQDGETLDAVTAAATGSAFQGYLTTLRQLLARLGVDLGTVTYADLRDRPEYDSLRADELTGLLRFGDSTGGVTVFVVRTMAPVGTSAMVDGTPGFPFDVGGGPGGVAVAVDAVCTRGWDVLARTTAHAVARHLGLSRNREPRGQLDPIADSDGSSANLMFYAELGGIDLSIGQRDILRRSPVLR